MLAGADRPADPSADADTSADLCANRLAHIEVLRALRQLDRVEHAALGLIYWRGYTQTQVAVELHLPVNTVRTAVARGMRKIADHVTAR